MQRLSILHILPAIGIVSLLVIRRMLPLLIACVVDTVSGLLLLLGELLVQLVALHLKLMLLLLLLEYERMLYLMLLHEQLQLLLLYMLKILHRHCGPEGWREHGGVHDGRLLWEKQRLGHSRRRGVSCIRP